MKIYDCQKIFDMLELIRIRDYWLSCKSIFALQDFLNGFMVFGKHGIYEETHKLIYYENDIDFNEFLYWLQDIPFVAVSGGLAFADFLFKKANSDSEKAFDLFYELLETFKQTKVKC